jgi:hypothetical protein
VIGVWGIVRISAVTLADRHGEKHPLDYGLSHFLLLASGANAGRQDGPALRQSGSGYGDEYRLLTALTVIVTGKTWLPTSFQTDNMPQKPSLLRSQYRQY